jgi:hypothetical protein
MRLISISAVLISTAIAISSVHAETNSSAWFGVVPPHGLSDPHKPVIDVEHVAIPPALVPQGEDKYRELQGARIFRDVEKIVDFSKESHKAGDLVWGRVTGFHAAKKTIDWAARQFNVAGLSNVEVQQYDATPGTAMWWPKSWEVKLIANAAFGLRSKDIVLRSAVPTSGSLIPNGSLTAALVYVGSVTDENLPDVDVRGKVAVQHLRPENGAFSERTRTVERAQELTKRGAVAVLNVVDQIGNMHVRDFGNCGAPCFNIGTTDGAFLEAILKRAATTPVQVQLQTNSLGLRETTQSGLCRVVMQTEAMKTLLSTHTPMGGMTQPAITLMGSRCSRRWRAIFPSRKISRTGRWYSWRAEVTTVQG